MTPTEVHSFNVHEASMYGINQAILLYNIRYWLKHNKANKTNNYDGFYWTYNSAAAFKEQFPYMKEGSIKNWLLELEEKKVIISANYNKRKMDRTKWYTIPTEFATDCITDSESIPDTIAPTVRCIAPKMQSIASTMQCIAPTVRPIPDINTYINTDKNTETTGADFEKVENDVENFPLPTIMKIWLKHFPEYYQSTKDDFPALNKICEQINKRSAALLDKQKLTEFAERFAAAVKLHKFYKDKSLKTIANHLQDILPIYNDPDGYVKKMSAPKYETDPKSVKIVLNNGQSAAYAENRHIKIRI